MNKELYTLILGHVCTYYSDTDVELVSSELSVILAPKDNDHNTILDHKDIPASKADYDQIQRQLSVINEKQSIRKSKGVYYTPLDLVDFMTASAIKATYGLITNNGNTDNHDLKTDNSPFDKQLSLVPAKDFCFNKTCFDPTCGTGEFLVNILNLKYQLASMNQLNLSLTDIRDIAKTIYGNDINPESITITHLRLFLVVLQRFGTDSIKGFFNAIASNFTAHDFVSKPAKSKHHIVIGNPPFVEQSKYQGQLNDRFGNIYANIILNAAHSLTEDGAFAFVIPISYTATPRMKAIRAALFDVLAYQYILSYADRPDCLFTGVHQKLCIVIAKKSNTPALYTSNYHYWYRSERKDLFNGVSVIRNPYQVDGFIPKLGNEFDVSVYQKVSIHAHKDQLNDSNDKDDRKVGAADTPITLKDLLSFDGVPLYLKDPTTDISDGYDTSKDTDSNANTDTAVTERDNHHDQHESYLAVVKAGLDPSFICNLPNMTIEDYLYPTMELPCIELAGDADKSAWISHRDNVTVEEYLKPILDNKDDNAVSDHNFESNNFHHDSREPVLVDSDSNLESNGDANANTNTDKVDKLDSVNHDTDTAKDVSNEDAVIAGELSHASHSLESKDKVDVAAHGSAESFEVKDSGVVEGKAGYAFNLESDTVNHALEDKLNALITEANNVTSLEDIFNSDAFSEMDDGGLDDSLFDMTGLSSSTSSTRAEADEIGRQTNCANFDEFEHIFIDIHNKLASGDMTTARFQYEGQT